MRVRRYDKTISGDVITVQPSGYHKIACCDCGLIHLLRFSVKKGVISYQVWRDNRATAQRRRKHAQGGK